MRKKQTRQKRGVGFKSNAERFIFLTTAEQFGGPLGQT